MRILVKQIGELKAPNFSEIADAVYDFASVHAETRLLQHGEKFVSNWDNPPSFRAKTEIKGADIIVSVDPVGNAEAVQHWEWVSRGTRKNYPIYPTGHPSSPRHNPSGPKYLRLARYAPHTYGKGPRVKTGGPGTRGAETKYFGPFPIIHPGIEPRHFEEAWRSWANLWWGPGIRDAIAKTTKSL